MRRRVNKPGILSLYMTTKSFSGKRGLFLSSTATAIVQRDKYQEGSSFMEKVKSDVRASPIVEKRTTGIRISRLYHTALYQREREDSLTVCRQCV